MLINLHCFRVLFPARCIVSIVFVFTRSLEFVELFVIYPLTITSLPSCLLIVSSFLSFIGFSALIGFIWFGSVVCCLFGGSLCVCLFSSFVAILSPSRRRIVKAVSFFPGEFGWSIVFFWFFSGVLVANGSHICVPSIRDFYANRYFPLSIDYLVVPYFRNSE